MRTETGMSRCFGFLTFKDPSVIDNILKQKHKLDGKDVSEMDIYFKFLQIQV